MFSSILYVNFFLILIMSHRTKTDFTKNCPFIYTVDLTESILLPNGSYLYHNDTVIPPQFVSDYNYTILITNPNTQNVRVHKRGCICAVKQCLPLCSDEMEYFYESYKSDCVDYGFSKNVTYSGGVVKRKHLLRDFHPIYGKVCDIETSYMMMPELEPHNDWTLYEVNNNLKFRQYDPVCFVWFCRKFQQNYNKIVCLNFIIL